MIRKKIITLIGIFLVLSVVFSIVEARYWGRGRSYGGYKVGGPRSNPVSTVRNWVYGKTALPYSNPMSIVNNWVYGKTGLPYSHPLLAVKNWVYGKTTGLANVYNNLIPTSGYSKAINPIQYYNLYFSGGSGLTTTQQTNVIPRLAAAQWAGIGPVGYSLSLVGPHGTTNFLATRGRLISADGPYGHYTFNTDPVTGRLISADGPSGHITYTQGGPGILYADGPSGRSTIYYSGGSMWADTPVGRVDFQLDSMGRPISATDPFGGVTYFNWGGTYIISTTPTTKPCTPYTCTPNSWIPQELSDFQNQCWHKQTHECLQKDHDCDGLITVNDIIYIAGNCVSTATTTTTTVPSTIQTTTTPPETTTETETTTTISTTTESTTTPLTTTTTSG